MSARIPRRVLLRGAGLSAAAVAGLARPAGVAVHTGVEAKILDADGTLDLPDDLAEVRYYQPTDHGNERNIAGLLPGLRELLGREATNQRRSEGNGPNR